MLLGYTVDLLVSVLRCIHTDFHRGWTHSFRSWSCFYHHVKVCGVTLLPDWWIMSHHPLPPSLPGFKYERVEVRGRSILLSVGKKAGSEQAAMIKSLLASGHVAYHTWGTVRLVPEWIQTQWGCVSHPVCSRALELCVSSKIKLKLPPICEVLAILFVKCRELDPLPSSLLPLLPFLSMLRWSPGPQACPTSELPSSNLLTFVT